MTSAHELCEVDKNIERVLARARNVLVGIGASCLALYTEVPSPVLLSHGEFFVFVAGGVSEAVRRLHVHVANQYAAEEAQRQTEELAASVDAVFEVVGTSATAQAAELATVGSE